MRSVRQSACCALLAAAALTGVACGSGPDPLPADAGAAPVASSAAPDASPAAPDATGEPRIEPEPAAPLASPAAEAAPTPAEPGTGFPGTHVDLGPVPSSAITVSAVLRWFPTIARAVCELPFTPQSMPAGSQAFVVHANRIVAVLLVMGETGDGIWTVVEDSDGTEIQPGDPVVLLPSRG